MTIQQRSAIEKSAAEKCRLNDEGETLDLFGAPIATNNTVKRVETKADITVAGHNTERNTEKDITGIDSADVNVAPIKTGMVKSEPKASRSNGPKKSSSAMKTISEVATLIAVPQHVLRFWETKFKQVKPMKRGGGRRYYRPDDVQLIQRIHHLLYNEGYTIKGVQRLLKISSKEEFFNGSRPVQTGVVEKQVTPKQPTSESKPQDDGTKEALSILLNSLKDIRAELG